jgi:hypothetical protein
LLKVDLGPYGRSVRQRLSKVTFWEIPGAEKQLRQWNTQEQRQRAVVVIVTLVGSSIDLWVESDSTVFPRFELQAFATTSTGP